VIIRAKRFIAAWRVLVGVWAPKRWDVSTPALKQYTKPKIPPPNPWIDRPQKATEEEEEKRTSSPTDFKLQEEPAVREHSHRPPSGRLIRHVLRARVEATNALAAFFDALAGDGSNKKIKVRPHLGRIYGVQNEGASYSGDVESWRYAGEVVGFLKKRGAKIPTLGLGPMKDDWAQSGEDSEGPGGS